MTIARVGVLFSTGLPMVIGAFGAWSSGGLPMEIACLWPLLIVVKEARSRNKYCELIKFNMTGTRTVSAVSFG